MLNNMSESLQFIYKNILTFKSLKRILHNFSKNNNKKNQ